MSTLGRKAILTLGGNRVVTRAATKYGLKLGANRFVAGESLDDSMRVAKELNQQGLSVTLDNLGEDVNDAPTARAMTRICSEVIGEMARRGLDANLSVKLTQIGLNISPELTLENMSELQEKARQAGTFIRIDMESSAVTDVTLDIVRKLHAQCPNVGTVIQAYLYRSPADLAELAKLGLSARIVKGAYMEPPEVAMPSKADTDAAYRKLVAQHLKAGCYTAIATHDDAIISWAEEFVRTENIPKNLFEFQMLYGIRTARQLELAQAGYKTRIYVPFGRDWYPYFVRRLAERPANLWFVAKNFLRR